MPNSELLPPHVAPRATLSMAIAAVGCLAAATAVLAVGGLVSPRRAAADATGGAAMVEIDARITRADHVVVDKPRFLAIAGAPATFASSSAHERSALAVTARVEGRDVVLTVGHDHAVDGKVAHASDIVRVRSGRRAVLAGADGMSIAIRPTIVRR